VGAAAADNGARLKAFEAGARRVLTSYVPVSELLFPAAGQPHFSPAAGPGPTLQRSQLPFAPHPDKL